MARRQRGTEGGREGGTRREGRGGGRGDEVTEARDAGREGCTLDGALAGERPMRSHGSGGAPGGLEVVLEVSRHAGGGRAAEGALAEDALHVGEAPRGAVVVPQPGPDTPRAGPGRGVRRPAAAWL